MTQRELKRFREMQELRRENREMEIMMGIWSFGICLALMCMAIWG